MSHPYLYPDQAPWTDDYDDLQSIRRQRHQLSMNYLGQFPVKVNQHFSATPEELNALVNACAFFYEYFSGDEICMSDWKDVARDEHLERYKQLASKFAQI